jgi:adenylate cyclase
MVTESDILNAKILIVDDQESNVLLLEQMLGAAGYRSVSSTRGGEQVCQRHLVERFDLILLDLQMPGMDGFQVMENLRTLEVGGYLPVLVITAQPGHELRALKAGAKDFVSKPFDLAEVLLRVHNLIEVRLLHQEAKALYQQVVAEQEVSARLLRGGLWRASAERPEPPAGATSGDPPGLVTGSFAEVALLFADLVEFTRFSEGASAAALAGVLDQVSANLHGSAGAHGLARTRILGDAWLATAALPAPLAERTVRAAHQALDLKEAVERFNDHGRFKLRIRIGLESNDQVAGLTVRRETSHDL